MRPAEVAFLAQRRRNAGRAHRSSKLTAGTSSESVLTAGLLVNVRQILRNAAQIKPQIHQGLSFFSDERTEGRIVL